MSQCFADKVFFKELGRKMLGVVIVDLRSKGQRNWTSAKRC